MPKVVVQTIESATMNAAAAAKTGRQRAASHSKSGNSRAVGAAVVQGSCGMKTTTALIAVSVASAKIPSMSSLVDGGSRTAEAIPMSNGATAMMPNASDAIQCSQIVSGGVSEEWNNT